MRRFCLVLVLPFLLANACDVAKPRADWLANDIDQARLGRLTADPWLRPEESAPGGTMYPVVAGSRTGLLRPSTKRWSEDPIPSDPYDALTAETDAAQQAGWFVTGVFCSGPGRRYISNSDPDPVAQIVVGFARPAADRDHAEAAYLLEEIRDYQDPSSYEYVPKGTILVAGVAPHHADRGWPNYVPVPLADTCIADPHHPRLLTKEKGIPKTNPPPPEEDGYSGPLDQAGKPFATWDDSSRFDESSLKKPVSSASPTSST